MSGSVLPFDLAAAGDDARQGQFLELVEAVVGVQRAASADGRCGDVSASLDKLLEQVEKSFRQQEDAMERRGSPIDAHHREIHAGILRHIDFMRARAGYGDQVGLLAQLLFLDRWLTEHFSEELRQPSRGRRIPPLPTAGVGSQHALPEPH
jgi:hemerythrin